MNNLIPNGPPVITDVITTDTPGFQARTLCLVDGYAAEITHKINTKRQDCNRHTLDLFDPRMLQWSRILRWGFDDVGHVPVHPESDAANYLSHVSHAMWNRANAIVTQSRVRQEQIDVRQHVAEHLAYQIELNAYYAAQEPGDLDEPVVDRGELVPPEKLDELRAQLTGEQ